jgi:hypothetical protein
LKTQYLGNEVFSWQNDPTLKLYLNFIIVENRTKHYGTLLQLKGKLDMMTRQIVAPADDESNVQPSKEALLGSRTHLKVLKFLVGFELLKTFT